MTQHDETQRDTRRHQAFATYCEPAISNYFYRNMLHYKLQLFQFSRKTGVVFIELAILRDPFGFEMTVVNGNRHKPNES